MLTDHFCDRVEHSVGRVCVCSETRLTVERKIRMVTHSRSSSRVSHRYEFTVTGGIKSQNSQEQTYVKPNRRDKKRVWIELDGAGSCIYYDVSANILMHVCGVSAS